SRRSRAAPTPRDPAGNIEFIDNVECFVSRWAHVPWAGLTYEKEPIVSDVRDVIIIGGDPAGFTAALYTARANLSPLVVEGFNWGGQLMITSDVENYPGYPDGILGPTMMQDFRRQAERFGAEFLTDDVTRVDFSERPFGVYVGNDEHPAAGVVLGTGAAARL